MSMRHWIWLSTIGLPIKSSLRLLERFENPARVYDACENELKTVLSASEMKVIQARRSLVYADHVLTECEKKQIQIFSIQDAMYPSRLRNIETPPLVLYVRGNMPVIDDEVAITVVGTRKPSENTKYLARTLAYDLARGGAIVVSGMAEGIDGCANQGALDAGSRTVAVLGCGVDICYPAIHRELMEAIIEHGCVISEYAPGVAPTKASFPARNRIMAGLSLGTLVVGAPIRSGSLITANLALDQGRDVFVVPGAINDAGFAGSNELLKQGESPVTEAADILQGYSYRYPQLRPNGSAQTKGGFFASIKHVIKGDTSTKADPQERKQIDRKQLDCQEDIAIVSVLESGCMQIDEIVEKTELPTATVLARLTILELNGMVCQKPGKFFMLSSK